MNKWVIFTKNYIACVDICLLSTKIIIIKKSGTWGATIDFSLSLDGTRADRSVFQPRLGVLVLFLHNYSIPVASRTGMFASEKKVLQPLFLIDLRLFKPGE